MANNKLQYNWGTAELPEDGEITEDVKLAFTNGHCHSFALAMHQATGWPIMGISYGSTYSSPGHCVVYCPQLDDYIDIAGPGALKRSRCNDTSPCLLEPGDIADLDGYRDPKPEMAKPFVRTVLANIVGILATLSDDNEPIDILRQAVRL